MKRLFSPGSLIFGGLLVLAATALVLWLTPSGDYILLPDKARAVTPLVVVKDGRRHPARGGGQIYFLAVTERKASLLERLVPWLREDGTLVPASALRTPGVSEQAQLQIDENQMSQSQSIAAAVALRALGYKVIAKPNGVQVVGIYEGAPAQGKLQPTDVIVALDRRPIRTTTQLRRLMRTKRPGELIRLSVRNRARLRTVAIKTVPDPSDRSRPVIGILIDQAAQIHLPIRIKIRSGSVVGPSAGLPFALGIMERLGRNVDRGYRVAATGQLEVDGLVTPIGGVRQKAIEARHAHVDILLIPAGENAREARRYAGNARVIPVKSFQQALHALATLPPKT
jgi:PDZ domain-containing protein